LAQPLRAIEEKLGDVSILRVGDKHPYIVATDVTLLSSLDDWVFSDMGNVAVLVGIAKSGKSFLHETLLSSRIAMCHPTAKVLHFSAEEWPPNPAVLLFTEFARQFCNKLGLVLPQLVSPADELVDLIEALLIDNPTLHLFITIDEAHFALQDPYTAGEFL
jgi:hypothetical protein